jgi:transcriptional regulator with XRE-family HTH domain
MNGMTQDELSRKSGVHQTAISRYLLGKSKPSLDKLQALEAVFPGLRRSQVISGTDLT